MGTKAILRTICGCERPIELDGTPKIVSIPIVSNPTAAYGIIAQRTTFVERRFKFVCVDALGTSVYLEIYEEPTKQAEETVTIIEEEEDAEASPAFQSLETAKDLISGAGMAGWSVAHNRTVRYRTVACVINRTEITLVKEEAVEE